MNSPAGAVTGTAGIASRLFLPNLVDLLDTIEQLSDFDPYTDYEVTISSSVLAVADHEVVSADEVEIDLSTRCR